MKRSSRCRTAFLLRFGRFFKARPSCLYSRYTRYLPTFHPRDSAARGSCDSRIAPCSVRSRGYASATLYMVPGGSGSDRCLAPSEEPGRHAARSPDTDRANDQPSDGDPRALELFSEHILQHRFIQAQVGNKLLQPAARTRSRNASEPPSGTHTEGRSPER
jgi:hypothetical protein